MSPVELPTNPAIEEATAKSVTRTMSRTTASRPVLPNVPPGPMNGLLIGERVEDAWLHTHSSGMHPEPGSPEAVVVNSHTNVDGEEQCSV